MDLQTVDQLLTTTRSVRKRLDFERTVPLEVVAECLELAIQAPTGSNTQQWRFLVVTDPAKRQKIAEFYQRSFELYAQEQQKTMPKMEQSDPRMKRLPKVVTSAVYLAENFAQVPVLILACQEGRVEAAPPFFQASFYGSSLPAVWSLCLALRSRGLGTCWTTLHLRYEQEVGELLGVPKEFTQTCLLPVAYFKGEDFQPAARIPAEKLTYFNGWGQTAIEHFSEA